ncbi:elongation factor Ts, mitochondrial [Oxobacter pfennigii]|uniref:Elongation factor Ts, mitochondrial n=1 Tax=Oxobacter pfennigii TaxID=36849 RepID=A0A0P8W9X6_9CLOT|nr:DUF4342 domain-containing protein [Oxobacter pfennigii]KPU44766.1 elongation factor Ts, mitochondrial [Oxobacter pfennigii]
MSINIELIDELKKRANVSYEDAKEALEKCDGDIVNALIYLEKNNKIKAKYGNGEKACFFDKVKALIKRGNEIRFIMRKEEKTVIDVSLNVFILIAILTFHVSVVGLLLALLFGYRFKFETNKGEDVQVNQTLDKVQDGIQNMKNNIMSEI